MPVRRRTSARRAGLERENANRAPIVDAGPDQTVTLPAGATLDATVTDDGRPSGALTATWTQTSGPGTTTFADAMAVDTTRPSPRPAPTGCDSSSETAS